MSVRALRVTSASVSLATALTALACHPGRGDGGAAPPASVNTVPTGMDGGAVRARSQARDPEDGGEAMRAPLDGGAPASATVPPASSDPMELHQETREGLLSLFSIKPLGEKEKKVVMPEGFLRGAFNTDGPSHINQGNKAVALHSISKEQCLAGLKGIVLQTPEQRELCGAENMVPVWTKGKKAWFCIDIFEFPNKPCELPVVWAPPTWDKKVCELQGKRLCSDIEWNISCRGDPEGGPDRRYAYGDTLDLDACNTNKQRRTSPSCRVQDSKMAWDTCATETEPSGAYPKCRSRFGVFDQHGNVAEVMMRREGDKVLTQLKGSAWFYRDLAREPDKPVPETTKSKDTAYPDHCNFDPRWHVEDYEKGAWHVNYHLGFRCCKSIP